MISDTNNSSGNVDPSENVELERICIVCHKYYKMSVPAEGLRKWKSGMLVQKAFPELSSSEREQIITGTHPECWDSLFK